ncbi:MULTISPECIES: hypothetical protein, partial [Limosilactobacillus]|uniref:hypothetical protein n=1 Tax=Limosilactobacillus TaxID=2742598 RepID=UPI0019D64BA7
PTPTLPLTGRINKQPVPRFRHELLNKIYSIFSSVLLDEEPKDGINLIPSFYLLIIQFRSFPNQV